MKKNEIKELKEEYKHYQDTIVNFGKNKALNIPEDIDLFTFAKGFVSAYHKMAATVTEQQKEIERLKIKLEPYREDEFLRYRPPFQQK